MGIGDGISKNKNNNIGNKCLLVELVLDKTFPLLNEKVARVMLEVDRKDFAQKNPYTFNMCFICND